MFGKTIWEVHEAGLVDSVSAEEFDAKLEAYHEIWDKRESAVHPTRSPVFYEWFVSEKGSEIKESMFLPVREAAGLGSPPSPFYTNICVSIVYSMRRCITKHRSGTNSMKS